MIKQSQEIEKKLPKILISKTSIFFKKNINYFFLLTCFFIFFISYRKILDIHLFYGDEGTWFKYIYFDGLEVFFAGKHFIPFFNYIVGSLINYFQFNTVAYKILFFIVAYGKIIIFYLLVKKIIPHNNFVFYSTLVFSGFSFYDKFFQNIIGNIYNIYDFIYILSFYLTIKYTSEVKSIHKKLWYLALSIFLIFILNFFSWPWFIFHEIIRFLIISVYFQFQKDVKIITIIKESLKKSIPYFFVFFIILIWKAALEKKFLSDLIFYPSEKYILEDYIKGIMNNPAGFLKHMSEIWFSNIKMYLIYPLLIFFSSLLDLKFNNYNQFDFFESKQYTSAYDYEFLKDFIFYELILISFFLLLILKLFIDKKNDQSFLDKKKFLFFFVVSFIFVCFGTLFYSLINIKPEFLSGSAFNRYTLPSKNFYILMISSLIFLISSKKQRNLIFLAIVSISIISGSLVYENKLRNERTIVKQLRETNYRFDGFNTKVNIISENHQYGKYPSYFQKDFNIWNSIVLNDAPVSHFYTNSFNNYYFETSDINDSYIKLSEISKHLNNSKNTIVVLKNHFSICFEFLDINTSKTHPQFGYITNEDFYNSSIEIYEKKPKKFTEKFPSFKNILLNKHKSKYDKLCKDYQILKKLLFHKKYDELKSFSEEIFFEKQIDFSKVFEDKNNIFILKPYIIGLSLSSSKEINSNLNDLKKAQYKKNDLKKEMLCEVTNHLKKNNLKSIHNFCNL